MPLVIAARHRTSYSELLTWPEDGRQYELYDGEVRVVPAPLPGHQDVVGTLYVRLRTFAEETGGRVFLSPFDIIFTEFDVLQPDLVVFGPDKASRIRRDGRVRFAPDLAIEVLSRSTRRHDRGKKLKTYARFTVPEVWLADIPPGVVEVQVLRAERYAVEQAATSDDEVRSRVFPGFRFPVTQLFRGLPPE
jgi:Uma2 family endonuclease